jgi:hypothetical protein
MAYRHAREHFSDAIDGQKLPFWTAVHVAFHRLTCPLCRRLERELKHTIAAGHALKDLPFEEPEDDAPKKSDGA